MSSIIEGYNCDIFISYRQKENNEKGRKGERVRGRLRRKKSNKDILTTVTQSYTE